jgi:hypothetical protein
MSVELIGVGAVIRTKHHFEKHVKNVEENNLNLSLH